MMKEDWQLRAEHREEVCRALPIWQVERDGLILAHGLMADEAKALYAAVALTGAGEAGYGRPRNVDEPWYGMFRLALVP